MHGKGADMSVLSAISVSRRPVLGFVAIGLMWGSFAAQVPVLKSQIGVDDAMFGLLLLASPAGLLTTMWLAPRVDAKLREQSLRLSVVLLAAAFLLPGLMTTPVGFLIAIFAMGLASGLVDILSNARVSELEAVHNRPLMNANHGLFSLAYALSALATGAAREAGWSSFAIFAAISAVVLVGSIWMRTAFAPVSDEARKSSVLPWVVVLLCGGIVLTAFFVEAVVESWSALHVERTLGGRAAEGAFAPAILGLTMAFGRLSGQAIAERFSELAVVTLGSGMACAGALLAAIAGSPWVAYVGFGVIGLGTSVVGPVAIALVGRMVPPAQRVRAVALVMVMGFGAFLFSPVVVGFVSNAFGLRVAFAVVAALALIAPLLAVILRSRQAQSP